ncbi:MAG: type VI secretion system baseplate subunit TssG [Alcanivorax sp.]|nr:type VI secretion system baseplate subunit TssG [Alcanivorax sp.]
MGATLGLRSADLINDLLRHPQGFDFVQAMELLEASDSQGATFGQGLDARVRLQPSEDLVFPAADIRGCRHDAERLTLLLGFLGLYGVDAPVPHYLLDRTTAEDDDAARMRTFLNIFNQRFYVLMYRALQISRPAAGRLPTGFTGTASALSGQLGAQPGRRRFPVGRVRTANGLRALLQDDMGEVPVTVEDGRPTWEALGEACVLGAASCTLGDNTVLGGRAWTANGPIAVRLGPMDAASARALLPGHAEHAHLCARVRDYLPAGTSFELHLRVRPNTRMQAHQGLGVDELHLGWSCWLGERLNDEYLIRMTMTDTAKGD